MNQVHTEPMERAARAKHMCKLGPRPDYSISEKKAGKGAPYRVPLHSGVRHAIGDFSFRGPRIEASLHVPRVHSSSVSAGFVHSSQERWSSTLFKTDTVPKGELMTVRRGRCPFAYRVTEDGYLEIFDPE